MKAAIFTLSKALQENPKSGELWALAIEMEPKNTRKAKIVDALKHNENNPWVIVSIARVFWKEKKFDKAKKWLERAIALDKNIGDSWIYFWKLV